MTTVFKFGGASIKDVNSIIHISNFLKEGTHDNLFIVFSAMGKVTNMLEDIVDAYVINSKELSVLVEQVKLFHYNIIEGLFEEEELIFDEVNNVFVELDWILEEEPYNNYSYNYDQIVSLGEILSTKIMSQYLRKIGYDHKWIDARDIIRTDNTFRDAKIDWKETTTLINKKVKSGIYLTQGFIGSTSENFTTTLGREGSDFTAAILAFSLEAKEVVIWKDVPGMMNADPRYFKNAELLPNVSYDEAIELAFFGAKVIHPKTIQPLKKKNIPLFIKSFINVLNKGTLIKDTMDLASLYPSYIVKENQILLSISDPELSFIVEEHMSQIFSLLALHSVRVNMMQNSAVSFSICIDNDKYRVPLLIAGLQKDFKVSYNQQLTLYTVRHYKKEDLDILLRNKKILLEQKSRNTIQIIAFEEDYNKA